VIGFLIGTWNFILDFSGAYIGSLRGFYVWLYTGNCLLLVNQTVIKLEMLGKAYLVARAA